MLIPYSEEIENQMKTLHQQLSEKERRLYAAIEAKKLPYGGIRYLAKLFPCSRETIYKGLRELNDQKLLPEASRIRHKGGGRKLLTQTLPKFEPTFLKVLEEDTAGNPQKEDVRYTSLTLIQITEELQEKGISVSPPVIKRLLKKHKYGRRKAQKKKV